MRLGQARLQFQSPLGEGARFFSALGRSVERVQDPAFQLRVPREGEREFRVELDCAIVELLALLEFVEILKSAGKIVRLDKSEIGLAIFCRLAFELCFLAR